MHKIIALGTVTILLNACYQPPEIEKRPQIKTSNAEIQRQQQTRLLEDFSGVWQDNGSLVTIYYNAQGQIHFIIDDRPIDARIGDIDTENETLNLLVTKLDDYSDGIITLRRKWTEDKKHFTLVYTSFDGSQGELGFVRRVSQDDQNRIANIYTQIVAQQYEMIERKPTLAEQLAHNQNHDQIENDEPSANFDSSTESNQTNYDEEYANVEDAVAAAQAAAEAAVESIDPQKTY